MFIKNDINFYEFQGHIINREIFQINYNIAFDKFNNGYETDWVLCKKKIWDEGVVNNVPFDLHPQYINEYKQYFEPSNFYRNIVTICAVAKKDTVNSKKDYLDFLNKYIEYALKYSITKGKSRFVTYDFDLKRQGYMLTKRWVSAIGNGFVIRALIRVYLLKKNKELLDLIREYIRPFLSIQNSKKIVNGKWFTWIDDEGFIWFDEYPGDDGIPSLVLNGHIHAMHAIHCFLQILPECEERQYYLDLYQAAMTTMKFNSLKFRRYNKINRYSLREFNKSDYLPDRTVRQQKELYRVTNDSIFMKHAKSFENDINYFQNLNLK